MKLRHLSLKPFSSATVDGKVLFEHHSPAVTEFKLNAPKALNSVDTEMCNLMIERLAQWEKDPKSAPRVLMMSGMGGKAFCAGGDIVSLYNAHIGKTADKSILGAFFAREYLLDYSLSQMNPT